MNFDFLLICDAGHGGIDPNTGKYTTAPAKQYIHEEGSFHLGTTFCEGVWNRVLVSRILDKCRSIGIPTVTVNHRYRDTPLRQRVDVANFYHRAFESKTLYVSVHANASATHTARGTEVWTSKGETLADHYAANYWERLNDVMGDRLRYRPDPLLDGNPDKDANFFVLRKTAMPAILVEALFFDQPDDAALLMQDDIVDNFAEAIVQASIVSAREFYNIGWDGR